ncbi:PAS domain-containing protein [Fischerella thermalis]|uniref:PAS domain-containing protein n=1 Tax=Fischerella thermalis TaxID=372787 RepID=UPI0030785B7E
MTPHCQCRRLHPLNYSKSPTDRSAHPPHPIYPFELSDWIAYTGQSLAEAENGGWIDAVHPDDRTRTAEVWGAAVANRSLYQIEYRIRAKDGTYRYFWVCSAPVSEEDGSVREWIGTCTDIHDRKLAEAENQRLKERYCSLVTATSQIVWGATPEGLGISSEMLTTKTLSLRNICFRACFTEFFCIQSVLLMT